MSTILITGGAGYIGSHTCVELLNEGYNIVSTEFCKNKYIKKFLDRMALLDQCSKDFVHDNTYHNIDHKRS